MYWSLKIITIVVCGVPVKSWTRGISSQVPGLPCTIRTSNMVCWAIVKWDRCVSVGYCGGFCCNLSGSGHCLSNWQLEYYVMYSHLNRSKYK